MPRTARDRGPGTGDQAPPGGAIAIRRFFVPLGSIVGAQVSFPPDQARHVATVLRLRPGDRVVVFDGTGTEYLAELETVTPTGTAARIIETHRGVSQALHLALLQGVPKAAKMDDIVRMGTELGVSEFIPFISARTVAIGRGRVGRWLRIAVEAAKQCRRRDVPAVHTPAPLPAALDRVAGYDLVLLLWEGEESRTIAQALAANGRGAGRLRIANRVREGVRPVLDNTHPTAGPHYRYPGRDHGCPVNIRPSGARIRGLFFCARRSGLACSRGRRGVSGRAHRSVPRGGRRSGLYHEHDRGSGGGERSLLPRADRGDGLPLDRQLRFQPRSLGGAGSARRRIHRARSDIGRLSPPLARDPSPFPASARGRRALRRRHAGAGAPSQDAWPPTWSHRRRFKCRDGGAGSGDPVAVSARSGRSGLPRLATRAAGPGTAHHDPRLRREGGDR